VFCVVFVFLYFTTYNINSLVKNPSEKKKK